MGRTMSKEITTTVTAKIGYVENVRRMITPNSQR